MTRPASKRSILAELAGRSTLLLAPLVVVILLLAAVPSPKPSASRRDPRRDAKSIQQSLHERIRAWIPGLEILSGAALDSADAEMLARDLFARARAGRPAQPATATPPFPEQGARAPAFPEEGGGSRGAAGAPPLPRLSAVLIDGPWRQALLDGRPVGEGGVVDGYEVIEITPRGVRLEKDGRTHTIGLGD